LPCTVLKKGLFLAPLVLFTIFSPFFGVEWAHWAYTPRCYKLLINGTKWECNKRNVFKGIRNVFKLTRLTSSIKNTSWLVKVDFVASHKKLYIKKMECMNIGMVFVLFVQQRQS
jgi:hypothetical protein